MTGQRPFLDENNPLLAGGPARLDTGVISLPAGAGNVGALTVRTSGGESTVFMTAGDLDNWAKAISDLAAQVRAAPVLDRASAADIAALTRQAGRPG